MRTTACALAGLIGLGATSTVSAQAPTAQPGPPPKPAATKPAAKPQDGLAGTWTGQVVQVGRTGGYTVELKITGKADESNYPELNCVGKLTRAGASGGYVFYKESITRGKPDAAKASGCPDGGITLFRSGDDVLMGWIGNGAGKPIVAYGVLTKAAGAPPASPAAKKN